MVLYTENSKDTNIKLSEPINQFSKFNIEKNIPFIQTNLQIQFNPHHNSKGIFKKRNEHSQSSMEPQKTQNA